MKRVLSFLRNHWGWAFAAPFFMLLEVMMDLQQPTLMSNIVDIGVATGNTAYIMDTGLRMVLCALAGVIGGLGCTVCSSVAAVRMAGDLRQAVFNKIQTFSFTELDRFKTSSLITRLTNDVTQIQQLVVMALRMAVRAPLICLGSIIMALRLSPRLSLVLLIALPVLLFSAGFLVKRAVPMFMTMQRKMDRINAVMRENLLGVRVIKAFVSQKQEAKRFDEANRDLKDWSVQAMNNMILLFPVVNLVMNLSVVAVLWAGGAMAIQGTLDIGKIMAFINYLTQILSSMMMVVMISMNLTRAKVSADRLAEVLETKPSIADGDFSETEREALKNYDIVFENVSYRYEEQGDWALKNVDLRIRQGETIGIIGPTGSGKTTLVSLIPRLYDVKKGRVSIGGVDVRCLPLNLLRSKIGMVLQESILFAGTMEENLRFGKEEATEEELLAACADAQAMVLLEEKGEGLKAWVEQRGKNFSGGQKQRLSLARTLVRQPEILILDDSTSAVDMITEGKIREALDRRRGSCTTLMIAQRVAAIKDADRILVLENGAVQAFGTHEEVLKVSPVYRRIAAAQLGEEVLAG